MMRVKGPARATGTKCASIRKGKRPAVVSDGAGRWLDDAFLISLVIVVNP